MTTTETQEETSADEAIEEGLADRADRTDAVREKLAELSNPEGPPSSLDDMRVTRDREGQLEPIKRKTLWEGHVIEFLPLTYRDRNRYRLDRQGLTDLGDDDRLEFLREHVVSPDFSEIDSLEDFGWTTIDDILLTVQLFSRDRRRDRIPKPVEDGGKAEE